MSKFKFQFQSEYYTKEDVEQAIKDLDNCKYKDFGTKEQGNEYNVPSVSGKVYGVKRIFECLTKNRGVVMKLDQTASNDKFRQKLENVGFKIIKKNPKIKFELLVDWAKNYFGSKHYAGNLDTAKKGKKVCEEFKSLGEAVVEPFLDYNTYLCSQWQHSGYIQPRLWVQFKHLDKKDSPFSISMFIILNEKTNKVELKIQVELDKKKAEKNDIEIFEKIEKEKLILAPYSEKETKRIIEELQSGFKTLIPYYEELVNLNKQPCNQILYGPPGTGKTYNTAIKINDILINNKTIKNTKVTKEITSETPWWQAIALTLYTQGKNRKFKVTEIENILADYIKLKNNNTVRNKLWEQLQKHTDFSSETVFAKDRNEPFVFDKTKDSEWYLTEKGINYIEDQLIDNIEQPSEDVEVNKFYNFITFHQSYSYEEFVEGIKPSTKNGQIEYKIENGIFKKMCIRANSDPDNNYVIVIDEINRGNISKIFGELITLIEEDKRIQPNGLNDYDDNTLIISESSKEKNSLTVTLPYSQEKFGVPKNLYILGTMNTSDRSIASVDIALRRRFVFKEMMPDSKLVSDFGCNFKKCFEVLNERISILLDRDHQIGHSYFIIDKYKNAGIKDLKQIWFDSIIPLLNEYFYGDWEKLLAILGNAEEINNKEIKTAKYEEEENNTEKNEGNKQKENVKSFITYKQINKKSMFACDDIDICEEKTFDFKKIDDFKSDTDFKLAMKNAFKSVFEEE